MIDLKQFAETYLELEKKAREIIKVHGLKHYHLDHIFIEEIRGKLFLNITAQYTSHGETETKWLDFELEEWRNDIEYFTPQNVKDNIRKK
jgi:hypothetical protein